MKNKTITSTIIGTVAIIGIAAASVAYAQGMHGQSTQGGMMGQTAQTTTQNGMHGQSTQGNMMGQTTQKATTNSMHGQAQTAKKDIRDNMHGNTAATKSPMAGHHNSK